MMGDRIAKHYPASVESTASATWSGLAAAAICPSLDTPPPTVDVVVPVYNEATGLEYHIRRLHEYLTTDFPFSFQITIVDNASTDSSFAIAKGIERCLSEVHALTVPGKGRGRALRHAWLASDSPALAYMDLDLSTDLRALLPLIAPLLSGHSDLAIGTRLARSSNVVRGTKREFISRCYNLILKLALRVKSSDAQCGFKAIRRDVAHDLLPLVEDNEWFFDTELIVLAERAGLRTHEVPVDWVDDPDSRVDIVPTAVADLKGIARIAARGGRHECPYGGDRRRKRGLLTTGTEPRAHGSRTAGQLWRFLAVGAMSTVAYVVLFVALESVLAATVANVVALSATAVTNTAINRRFTFGVKGRHSVVRHQLQGLAVFLAGLALTEATLTAIAVERSPNIRMLQLPALLAANLAATILRFTLFRTWVFAPREALFENQIDSTGGVTR